MTKKTTRDPNAPKRNLSAYLLYQNAMRNHFKAQNPGMTFGQLAKYTSAMYAEMSPEEKEAWNQRAEADKVRYLHELSSYVPPPGYDAKGDAIQAAFANMYGSPTVMVPPQHVPGVPLPMPVHHPAVKIRRGKAERDANAPKRNVSAYLLYQNAMRAQFKAENPDMSFGQLAKYTSHMYKNLTPEEKATWDQRAQEDKARYDAQIAVYVPPPGHDARGNVLEQNRPGKRSRRGPKDPSAPKRARGSFVFFTFEMRPVIMKENPNVEFVQMGTILGERWRALTPEQKKRYEDMAAADKLRFQVEMEKYKANIAQSQATIAQMRAHGVPSYHYGVPPAAALPPQDRSAYALQHELSTVTSTYEQPVPAPSSAPAPGTQPQYTTYEHDPQQQQPQVVSQQQQPQYEQQPQYPYDSQQAYHAA